MCSWGVIASLQCLTFSFSSLLILRALLGIGEAAFVGIPFFLSFFYKRDELAFRTGLFISAAPLATSFAGTLAWCITRFGDNIPIASWRVLLLVEGFPSVVVAVFVFLHIPDTPNQARYLTRREKKVAVLRLRKENDVSGSDNDNGRVEWQDIRETLMDPKCYLTAVSPAQKTISSIQCGLLKILRPGHVLLLQRCLQLSSSLSSDNHRRVRSLLFHHLHILRHLSPI